MQARLLEKFERVYGRFILQLSFLLTVGIGGIVGCGPGVGAGAGPGVGRRFALRRSHAAQAAGDHRSDHDLLRLLRALLLHQLEISVGALAVPLRFSL